MGAAIKHFALTMFVFRFEIVLMPSALQIVTQARQGSILLDPDRRRLLESLATPDSASGLGRRLGMSRQVVSYHLKELEKVGLITLAEERRKGNCTERLMQRAAMSYVIDPAVLGPLDADPATVTDRLSAAYLMAVAARSIREISHLSRAAVDGKMLPTLALEAEIRFRNGEERTAFIDELTARLSELVRKYDSSEDTSGASFRFFTASYPVPIRQEEADEVESQNAPA
jgi:DNA-binding transcriptional ArsR family regulator